MRKGYSLIELMVVIAIIAMLAGLILSAVQKMRNHANLAICSNNLKQIGLATQLYHATNKKLPPGNLGNKDPMRFSTWHSKLLPYLEQESRFEAMVNDYKINKRFVKHSNFSIVLPVFICPSNGKTTGRTIEGANPAFTHYMGIAGSTPMADDGLIYYRSKVSYSEITDGLSNTLLCGERPASQDNHFGWWYAGIGQDTSYGSLDSFLTVHETNRSFRAPTCPRGPYSFTNGSHDDMCSVFHFWSGHSGGANFLRADGSVIFIKYNSEILDALSTRSTGDMIQN